MHDFVYRGKTLYCERVRVADVAERVGTPFYLYSHKTIVGHFRKIKNAFSAVKPLICYSMKANSNLAVCRALLEEGAGFDVVSGGELFKALKIGADPKKIVYASVGKTADEIRAAIRHDILLFNIESLQELRMINAIAGEARRKVDVAIRVNPDVDTETHAYIKTGKRTTKFGIDFGQAEYIFDNSNHYPWLNIAGLHIHVGSQITDAGPFVRAIKKTLKFVKAARINVRYLDIGGGMGIIYSKERPQTAKAFADEVMPLIEGSGLGMILEPGRFIVGNGGILVTGVIYTKRSHAKNFMIVDAGMNDLIRPSLYGAYHDIRPVCATRAGAQRYDVVGPICESGDFLGKERVLPAMAGGELLAVFGAGAYGFSMSSNYNARPRACEVMVFGDKYRVIRKRETYDDLIRGETMPNELK